MQKEIVSLIKKAFIEYAKSHSEYQGKIMDIFNHLDEALQINQSLPIDVQNSLGQIVWGIFAACGVLPAPYKS